MPPGRVVPRVLYALLPMRQLTFWKYGAPAVREVRADATTPKADASVQPPYPGTGDLDRLALWLSCALYEPVSLMFTRNRSTMVSFRRTRDGLRLRLHQIFLRGDADIMRAVVGFIQGERHAGRALDKFVLEHPRELPPPAIIPIRSRGDCHDLEAIFDDLNSEYFHEGCGAHVTWGTPRLHKGQRALAFGTFWHEQKLIVVHPCLDQTWVPRYIVSGVVFHQMLHELFGLRQTARGRCITHPRDFALVESSYPDHERCVAWLREHTARLRAFRPDTPRRRGVRKAPTVTPTIATG